MSAVYLQRQQLGQFGIGVGRGLLYGFRGWQGIRIVNRAALVMCTLSDGVRIGCCSCLEKSPPSSMEAGEDVRFACVPSWSLHSGVPATRRRCASARQLVSWEHRRGGHPRFFEGGE